MRGEGGPRPRIERTHAESLLARMLGPQARFREGQWEAIDAVANQRKRLLVVQRTGWGKSVVYFLATAILRGAGEGPTLLVSPLLALMRNQIAAAEKLGIRARTIHSENFEEWAEVEATLREDRCDLLMVSPERLSNAEFLERLLPLIEGRIGMLVVDEAHCISDWGHDFRPDYRRIARVLRQLPDGVPVVCTTATANDRVVQDVLRQIPDLELSRGSLIRSSLRLFNITLDSQAERLAWLAHFLPRFPGSGVVYALTIQDTRRVAEFLQRSGIVARPYHADLSTEERVLAEGMLIHNDVKALVATVALGMGFDKPDLGFVIHFQRPGSVVAYYQQVGRAGRALDQAYGILLCGREDEEIVDYFIRTAFPPAEVMETILRLLRKCHGGMTLDEIGAALNQPRGTIEKALKLLEVDDAVRRKGGIVVAAAGRFTADVLRAEQVTALRRAEVQQMRQYVEHEGCLMEFLARALDDASPTRCGKCMNCCGTQKREAPPDELVSLAVEFLRGDSVIMPARQRWPKPLLGELQRMWPGVVGRTKEGEPSVMIPHSLRAQEGRALCIWGDAGWGSEVAKGKYESGRLGDELVAASAKLIRDKWRPDPFPQWIAPVPSLSRPELVRDFAERLATRLGLRLCDLLRKVRRTPPQKTMENSVLQVRNILGAFSLTEDPPRGAVLLVDDMVDSGWTITLLAVLLQQRGSGPVHPFALAKASPRGG